MNKVVQNISLLTREESLILLKEKIKNFDSLNILDQLRTIQGLKDLECVPELREIFRTTKNFLTGVKIVKEFGELKCINDITSLTKHKDPFIRQQAVIELSKLGLTDIIESMIGDVSWLVRSEVIKQLKEKIKYEGTWNFYQKTNF